MQLQLVIIVQLGHIKVHGQLQIVVSAFLALVVHIPLVKVAFAVLCVQLAVMLYLIIHFKYTQAVKTVQVELILYKAVQHVLIAPLVPIHTKVIAQSVKHVHQAPMPLSLELLHVMDVLLVRIHLYQEAQVTLSVLDVVVAHIPMLLDLQCVLNVLVEHILIGIHSYQAWQSTQVVLTVQMGCIQQKVVLNVMIVSLELTAPVAEVQNVSNVHLGIIQQNGTQLHVQHAVQAGSQKIFHHHFAFFVHQAHIAQDMGKVFVLNAQMACIA
jgi:hypothetical protein